MTRILLTDGEQRSTLAAVRSLGRAGHRVGVTSRSSVPLAGASRYCDRVHVLSDPTTESLSDLLDREDYAMVIPMTDAAAEAVLGLRSARPEVVIPFPEASTYRAVSDKQNLLAAAERLGLGVPEQVVVDHRGDVALAESWAEAHGFDVVLKPARSAVETTDGTERFAVSMVASREDLRRSFAQYSDEAFPILVQERIKGPGLGAFLLVSAGETRAVFAHRRIREKPPTGGVSVYRESVALDPALTSAAERVLSEFGWEGVAMVEFKQSERTGELYLMEVNGRFWGSLQLAVDAGVDFPRLLVESFEGRAPEEPPAYRVGVKLRWFWGDVDHLLSLLRMPRRARVLYPSLPSRPRAVARMLVPWRPGERWEVFRFGDPRPFLRESWQWFAALR